MKRLLHVLRNELVTGAVLLAPVVGTLYLVFWVVRSIDSLFPNEYRPRVLGYPLPGVGIVAVLVLALAMGLVAHNFIGRKLVSWIDRGFQAVPLFGGTYGLIKQVFESVFSQGADSFQRAVLVEYPRQGSWVIAFVTSSTIAPGLPVPAGADLVSVFIPTTPNPTSGFYLMVERSYTRPIDMTVAEAFKLLVTMGIAKEPEMLTTTAKLSRETLSIIDPR
ncbi:MAG: DUF502 domain-containing protein [Polyangia bacterium]